MYFLTACGGGGNSDEPTIEAPSALSYSSNPAVYELGTTITTNIPDSSGGAVTAYSINPVLPAGLTLNTSTGVISGTPTTASALNTYTVSATNSAGSTTVSLPIATTSTVANNPPTGLGYSSNPEVYEVGTAITANSPSSSGGAVVAYSVNPSLPTGLVFSTSSGIISGTPTVEATTSSYTVTAANSAGSTSAILTIEVSAAGTIEEAPSALSYSANPAVYEVGALIVSNSPSNSGGTVATWFVDPALPAGLTLDRGTGVISGTPTVLNTLLTDYTVTASNNFGSTTASVSIATTDFAAVDPPTNLSYAENPVAYQVGDVLNAFTGNRVPNYASVTGSVIVWSVTPDLPAGLSLGFTGRIVGTANEVTPAASYTVTAANSAGSTTAIVIIEVNETGIFTEPPTSLSYSDSSAVYMEGIGIQRNFPGISGGVVDEYSVSPALPAGLTLDPVSGFIDGAPTAAAATADYTVTASNSVGSTSTTVSISVDPQVSITTTPVGTLAAIRTFATTTLLPNGKVLIAGGIADKKVLDSAELYDPATGTLTTIPNSMIKERAAHTATLLPNGKVLLVGGVGDGLGAITSVEQYDPVTETFSRMESLSESRGDHTATVLPNGKVLIAGGGTSCYVVGPFNCGVFGRLRGTELYDPATDTFSNAGNLSSTRLYTDASLLPDGKVLFAGGRGINEPATAYFSLSSAELYDPVTGSFAETGSLSTTPNTMRMTLLPNGKVLATHGLGADIYDPATGIFTALDAPGASVKEGTPVLLPNGKVLINSNGALQIFDPLTNSFSLFATDAVGDPILLPNGKVLLVSSSSLALYIPEPVNHTFNAGASLVTGRTLATATLLPSNGKVLVAGGRDASTTLLSAELYDPVTDSFNTTGALATARRLATATLLPTNGKVLIAGGLSAGSSQSSAELYDPVTGDFSVTGSLVEARLRATAILLPSNGKVLIAGGSRDGVTLSSAELYDPVAETFSPTGSLNEARFGATMTLLPSGKVLVAGGGSAGSFLASAELYDPATGTFTATGTTENLAYDPDVDPPDEEYIFTGRMIDPRVFHTTTLMPNGKVLIAGGIDNGVYQGAEIYDPLTESFVATDDPFITERIDHTATLLANGQVLIAGGFGDAGYLSEAELYDPATNSFTATDFLATARSEATATLLPTNGAVLITGGIGSAYHSSSELYQ